MTASGAAAQARNKAAAWVTQLRAARLRQACSQERLAQALSVSPGTICSWESGRRIPTLGNLLRIGRELGLKPMIMGSDGSPRLARTGVIASEQWEQREIRALIGVLRRERRENQISQEALASEIGISVGSLVRFENGQMQPRPAVLAAWAAALGCTVRWRPTV